MTYLKPFYPRYVLLGDSKSSSLTQLVRFIIIHVLGESQSTSRILLCEVYGNSSVHYIVFNDPFALYGDGKRIGEIWGLNNTDGAPQSTATGLGPLMLSVFLGVHVVHSYGDKSDA